MKCNTGTTNISGTCVSYDWNSSSNAVNTLLEDGGSLYGDGTNQSLCVTIPLTSANCSGYAVAYLNQQCDLSALYDDACTGYTAAYLLQQCNLDIFYSVNCVGYDNALFDSECDELTHSFLHLVQAICLNNRLPILSKNNTIMVTRNLIITKKNILFTR